MTEPLEPAVGGEEMYEETTPPPAPDEDRPDESQHPGHREDIPDSPESH